MTTPTPFTVQAGGATLAGFRAGRGLNVVFLHAGVADKRMWLAQVAALGETACAVAYDRRGFGETTTPNESYANVTDLSAVLDDLGQATAVLVGCSQGGLVALDFALAHPERVRALVLVASAVSGAPPMGPLPPLAEERVDALDAAEEAGDLAQVNELEAVLWLDGPASPAGRVGGPARALFLDMNAIALAHPELTGQTAAPPAYDRLAQLAMPVLVLWGDLDFSHIQQRAEHMLATIPAARGQVIPGTAHLPNLERPELFNDLLRDFLGSLDR